MKRNNTTILLAIFLVFITVLARIINAGLHIPNIVPIAALSVFCGAIIKENRALAFLIPILGQFIADVYFQLFTNIPGFYDLSGMAFNYAALIAATGLGTLLKEPKMLKSVGFAIGGSLVFFLVSNFGYFAHGWNGYSITGLTKTYIDAIPFFKNTFMADAIGGVLLFGGYFVAQQQLLKKAQKIKA